MNNPKSKIKILCDENIQSRSGFRMWAKKNHPDKTNNSAKHERFKEISSIVEELLPNNESKIDCDDKTPQKKVPVFKPFDPKKVNTKKADCLRMSENWVKIMKHHRFDKPSFNPKLFLDNMKTMSPKMVELINNIKNLDDEDFKRDGKRYKHFIFSDVKKGGCGAKIISSALVASGFNHCFTPSLKVVNPKAHDRDETFGVLSSTAIYNTPFTQKHVKSILKIYNERPTNIYGENMRFIVLDSGFKEGVDLFDVKYVHIFENQRNNADLVQAVGRATRSCGQKGLNFVPNVGWKLHVYQYYLTYEDPKHSVFDDYLEYAGVDLNTLYVSETIEQLAIKTAVDYDLNININKFEGVVEEQLLELEGGSPVKMGCHKQARCGSKSNRSVPFSLALFKRIYKNKLPTSFNKLLTKDKRKFFCDKLKQDPQFCKDINDAYYHRVPNKPNSKDIVLLEDNNKNLVVVDNKSIEKETYENLLDMKEDMKNVEDMTFEEFQRYINKVFSAYKYKPIKIENLCETSGNDDRINDDRIVKFTESQDFITNYFVPNHFAKGILVWHSVGTGKTCTAISVKSFLFERMDYSVVWVTRNTLKEDIWKNMYDKICDHIIRDKVKSGKDADNLRKYLSKKFLPPMSYRQFSNMLAGKNELYKKLEAINGKEDILKNTLVIIDEAHKLYSKDLVAMERPDMKLIESKFEQSPTSKVMLMTGTPIADDPMEFIKLMNLVMKKNKFPVDFDTFKKEFMLDNEFTREGRKDFQNRCKGLISYLNRRFDPRQFAQPKFYKKPVTLSVSPDSNSRCMENAENRLDNCMNNIVDPDDVKIVNLNNEINAIRDEIEDLVNNSKLEKSNKQLKDLIKFKKNNLKNLKSKLSEEKKFVNAIKKKNNKMKTECKKTFTKEKNECKKKVSEDETMYQNVAFQKC